PVIVLEHRERLRRHAAHGPAELCRDAREEVCDEGRDVLAPLAERRQVDRDDVQPVKEILAERSVGDGLRDVTVRRGDQPNIDLEVARVADATDLALLDRAPELDLYRRRDLGDPGEE